MPQGNGRIEVAGKRIKDILRKMHAEEGINWMEALPRATKLYNTTPNGNRPSPYTTLFGRNWLEGGLSYDLATISQPAESFIQTTFEIDQILAKFWNENHKMAEARWNKKFAKLPRKEYQSGDWVWVLRNPNPGKMESWWVGPTKIIKRIGDQSYQVSLEKEHSKEIWDVHWDFLKP